MTSVYSKGCERNRTLCVIVTIGTSANSIIGTALQIQDWPPTTRGHPRIPAQPGHPHASRNPGQQAPPPGLRRLPATQSADPTQDRWDQILRRLSGTSERSD